MHHTAAFLQLDAEETTVLLPTICFTYSIHPAIVNPTFLGPCHFGNNLSLLVLTSSGRREPIHFQADLGFHFRAR